MGAFNTAYAAISNNRNILRQAEDENAIESILSKAMATQDPAVLQNSIGQILSKVSPQNQGPAIQYLQSSMKNIQDRQKQQREMQAAKELGYTYGAPSQVQAQQVKDKAKSERLGQFGLGNNIPKSNIQQEIANVGIPSADQNQQPTFQSPIRNWTEDQLVMARGSPDLEIREMAKAEQKRRSDEAKAGKSFYEPEAEKLEAKRVADLATEIENEYQAAKNEDIRLDRMGILDEKGNVSTPLLVKALDFIGLPIGILNNPDTEEYRKLEADFVRDVSKVFPGGRITNYEIGTYLKTVPTLMNTPEGRKAIYRNRKLLNEAKKLRYNAYSDIVKENNGKKPPNLNLLINERISDKLSEIEEKFMEGISKESEKFQQPIRMYDPEGNPVDIPPNLIERALMSGAKFR